MMQQLEMLARRCGRWDEAYYCVLYGLHRFDTQKQPAYHPADQGDRKIKNESKAEPRFSWLIHLKKHLLARLQCLSYVRKTDRGAQGPSVPANRSDGIANGSSSVLFLSISHMIQTIDSRQPSAVVGRCHILHAVNK